MCIYRSIKHLILVYFNTYMQEAQREYVDDHSTVQKQRAKKFNLEEELERLKRGGSLDYENKPLPRPKQD